ncbi:hypothetical protein [Actinomadura algeriensis]|uniref:Uncharacterized protein n=1 Tax=Actinomadura algeriensis TaxID=1679523 RepID=A0ABR9JJ25_9ACTN|nr:hypothetical protein [Actinomadura algeriensis]MBE1530558.1 hypothetical protein [Actinomadura algeriensis]
MRRTRTERRVAASARHGRAGARAWRRLVTAAARGGADARDGVVRIARTPGHPRNGDAKRLVARWWLRERDPGLRQVVRDTGATALAPPGRLVTQALLNRTDGWDEQDVPWLPRLLGDRDPAVREAAAAFCRTARGAVLDALWDTDPRPGSPLRDALLANAEPAPYPDLDALWDESVRDDSGALRDVLLRWGRSAGGSRLAAVTSLIVGGPAADPAALLDAHPLADLAARRTIARGDHEVVDAACERAMREPELLRFCRKRGLVPRDPARRALFFVLAGRPGQCRALDPDGSLFALAYAAASPDERARARKVLLAEGDLDLVRVIVRDDRRTNIADMSHEEIAYFAERLADRREWAELWTLVLNVPVESGTALVRLIRDWRPRDGDGRRLFAQYLGMSPAAVRAALRRLREEQAGRPVQTEHKMPTGAHDLFAAPGINDLSFSPDRSPPDRPHGVLLAVATMDRGVRVIDPWVGRLARRHGHFPTTGRILDVGEGTVLVGVGRAGGPHRLVRCDPDGTRTAHPVAGLVTGLARTGPGGAFAAVTAAGELVLGSRGERDVTVRDLRDFGVGPHTRLRAIAAHPGTNRLAVLGDAIHLIDPADGTAETVRPAGDAELITYADADTVAYADSEGSIALVPLRGGAERRILRKRGMLRNIAAIHRGIATVDTHGCPFFIDITRPDPENTEPSVPYPHAICLAAAPFGEMVAIGHNDGVVVVVDLRGRELDDVVRRPLAGLLPRHADLAAAVLERPAAPHVRALLELFRAALEHRFRFDVEVDGTVRPIAGDDDIGLGGER